MIHCYSAIRCTCCSHFRFVFADFQDRKKPPAEEVPPVKEEEKLHQEVESNTEDSLLLKGESLKELTPEGPVDELLPKIEIEKLDEANESEAPQPGAAECHFPRIRTSQVC